MKTYILEEEKRRKKHEDWAQHLKHKQAQATAENPDIRTIGFSVRLENILKASDIVLLKDLSEITEKEFLHICNSGVKALEEAKQKMKEYNLFFKGDFPIP